MKKKLLFVILSSVILSQGISLAQTYYAVVNNGAWNAAATWSTVSCAGAGGAGVPGAGNDVVICPGINVNMSTSPSCNNLTIDGTLSVIGNVTLTVNGNMTMNSPSLLRGDNNGSQIDVAGDFTISDGSTISGTNSINVNITGQFICNAGAGVTSIGRTDLTISGASTINGDLTFILSAAGNKSFRDITLSATGVWDNTVGEDPRINGNIVNNGSWLGPTGGTADYQFGRTVGGNYTISGNPVVFSRLSIENGTTVTNLGTVIVDGNVDPGIRNRNGGGNATFNNGDGAATAVLYLQTTGGQNPVDATVNNLTFNASFINNTVYYSRGGNQNIRIPDDACYYNLVCATSGTKTVQAGTTGIRNSLTIQDVAIVDVGTNTLADGCGGSADLTMTGTSQLIISKCNPTTVPELTGTYSLTGGTIELDGGCAQTLQPGVNYYDIVLSNSGVKTLTGVTTVNGDITVSNSATISGAAFTMSCSKTFTYNSTGNTTLAGNLSIGSFSHTNTGDVIDGGNTITVCGSSWDRTSATANFIATGRVIFNPSSGTCSVTSSAAANITQFKSVTINALKTLVGDVNGINIGNGGGADWTNDGTFTHNSGTVTAVGNIIIQGSSATTFNNLTITAGILTGHSTNINIEGNWTNNSAFTHNNGTVTFTGGNAHNLAGSVTTTFFDLEINKTAGTTLTQTATTTTVNNLLRMTEGIFDINALTLNGAGGFTATGGDLQLGKAGTVPELTGAYTITGGTVTLDRGGTQTLNTSATGGDTYYNLIFATSGAKTIAGLLTINGDVTVSGTATIASTNSAFVQASGKTFNYNSTGSTTVATGVAISVGNYTQTSGTFVLPDNAGNIFTITGISWNKSGGTFTSTATNSVVNFQGTAAQTFTDNGTTFNKVIINNVNGITLNNNMTIAAGASALTFTDGKIITGSNNVILTSTAATVITPGTGKFVEGNLRKAIAVNQTQTFEVGTGNNYTPATFVFAGNSAGNWTVSATGTDHPDIFASSINPSKTVNRYWSATNNSIATVGTYSVTFNFINPDDMDVAFDWSTDTVLRYDGISWSQNTMGSRTSTNVQITGVTTPISGSSEDFQIGNDYNSAALWNRVTGGGNLWSDKATWIQDRKGGITTSTASTTVTGTGTKFTTELVAGDIIMTQTSPGTGIGTVASITDDVTLTLTANAATDNASASYGRQKVPDINDEVNIGNLNLAGASVTIIQDMASAECTRLTFTTMAQGNTLTHNAGTNLDVLSNVTIRQPSNGNTNVWDLNTATATVDGNVQIGSANATAGRLARVNITTGTLNIGTNLVFQTATAANARLDMTGGAGRVNLSGNLTLSSQGTLSTAGTENIFNYNRTISGQTVTFGSSIAYRNLYINNTSASGATLGAAVTTTNITGDIHVQSGRLNSGGYTIAGNAGRSFIVDDNAIFRMTGTAAFPNGFGTFTFGPLSTTQYWQTNAQNISVRTYGNLSVQPLANGIVHTFFGGTTTVAGNLILGNGVNTGSWINFTAAAGIIDVAGNVTISPNTTFIISGSTANPVVTCAGDWTNNGGTFTPGTKTVTFDGGGAQQINGSPASQTFYDIIVTKTAGSTLTVGGSTTALNTNNITINSGNFTAPATLNLNSTASSSMTLNGGTLTAGALITIRGHWTNNGGTFDGNGGLVQFVQGTNPQNINGTAATQSFYDVEINKSAGVVTIGGSTTTVNITNNYTQTAFGLNASAAATLNVGKNFTITSGTFNNLNNIQNLNIGGNILYNGGTWTMSNNVTFNGTSAQTVGGSSAIPNFTNLTVNNTYPATAVTLNTPLTVDGVFTLTDGHLVTDATNILTLTDNATVGAGANDSSFVKGYMAYQENDNGSAATKVFPVGKANLMHQIELNITHSSNGTNTYTATYFLESEADFATTTSWTLPATLERVSGVGHWDLTKSGTASISNGSVKLYYLASDYVTDIPNLCVAKGNPSAWSDINGTAVAGSVTSGTNFTTFSRFSLANKIGGTNPLPVELLSFNAELNNGIVDLTWVTATEINNDYFTIEKTRDGKEFEEVAIVKGAGNSNEVKEYFSTDKKPYKGISYYRLKQTDTDGRFTYSEMVAINNTESKEADFIVFPNPSDGKNVNVSLKGSVNNEEVLVVLSDIEGREIYSKVAITDDNGSFIMAIDIENRLPTGIYIIVGSSKNDIYSRKLVIKKSGSW